MSPRFVFLAILAGILLSPAVHTLLPNEPVSQRITRSAPAGVDPIGPSAYHGFTVIKELTIEESTQRAGLIVVGRVQSQTARTVPGSIVTDITVQVEQQLKGAPQLITPNQQPQTSTVTFTVQGGTVGNRSIYVGGQPFFVNGERVLLFLRSATDRQLVQMYTSRYTLAGSQAIQPEHSVQLSISELEQRMIPALGGPVSIGATSNQTVQSAPFTTFCIPWSAGQMPVPYHVHDGSTNTSTVANSTTLAGNNAAAGVQAPIVTYQSLALWQGLSNSAMAFRIAGATAKDGTDHTDGENTIAWANINVIPGGGEGVIGLNYCQVQGGQRHDSDVLINNNASWQWDSFPDDGITTGRISVKAVLAHELGHGLGLNHSDAPCPAPQLGQLDSGPTMCASIYVGWDKFIQLDDQNGAANRYPISGAVGPPGAPTGLNVSATSATSNTLNWTASGGSKFAYEIERATPDCNSTFRSVNTVGGTTTTFLDNRYGYGLPAGTPFCYRVKALGVGGDSAYSNATSSTPQCPPGAVSLWSPATVPGTPAFPDFGSYELGVKFRSDVAGAVCGIKFYKGTGNGGLHTGRLWTTNGTLLASGTFSNETATGWQSMAFSQQVNIQANTTYIVSYSDPTGRMAYDANYFTNQYSNGVLNAPSNASVGGNGVWSGGAGNFPSQSGGGANYWVDVLFIPNATPSSCTGTTRSIFAQQAVPGVSSNPDPNAYTLGVRFTAEVPGIVCGVRFYKGSGNVGTHTGQLWTSNGTQLATVTFTNETATGWQQAFFSNPVQISANVIYVISYTTPFGNYAFNAGQFSNGGVDNPPLHIPSNAAAGGNGVYGFGLGVFPSQSAGGGNFWVDVIFQANAGLCGTSTMTVFSPASTPAVPDYPDGNSYEIGVKFTSDVAGQVCGVRFYKGAGNGGTHVGRVWNSNGTQLASATFVGETATGWQQVLFSSPVQITANTTYIASYSAPQGRYAINQNQLSSSIDNAPLHLPASGASGGNGVYAFGVGNFPGSPAAGHNFWVDVVFAPGSSSGGLPDSCTSGSSSVFLSTSVPGTPSHPDPSPYEFGMKFRSDVNGVACGVRFYKGPTNIGTHTGRLWSSGGVLLASVVFTNETATGWQQALFSAPVALTSNTIYVVSYTDPFGGVSYDANAFNNSINNGILHAPSNAQSGGNGLYGVAGTFPGAANGSNFWVDILFAPTCPCSVWSNAYVPTTPAHSDTNPYELGMRFRPEQNGFITGVRFYKGAGNGGTHVGRLWRADGALLAAATFTSETATGWQQVSFATPVFVSAGGTYVVSYSDPQGRMAFDVNYFTTGIESGPLTVFAHSQGGNAVYASPGVFPSAAANGNNFWVDAVWTSSCLGCVMAAPAPVQAAAATVAPPPPPPGSAAPLTPPPAGGTPPGSQQIRPPTGDQTPPIPAPPPAPPASPPPPAPNVPGLILPPTGN